MGPWDASPPTLENPGTKCAWSPPTFATGCDFLMGTVPGSTSTNLLAAFKGEMKTGLEKGVGETGVEQ